MIKVCLLQLTTESYSDLDEQDALLLILFFVTSAQDIPIITRTIWVISSTYMYF